MSIQLSKTIKISLVCSAVMSALTASSFAAEQTGNVDGKADEYIIVTARKKTETIIEIPMNISTVSSLEISDRNLINKEDIYRTIAGASSPRSELILRGISGSNDHSPGTTTTFTDGIPYNFSNLYDVERIEILRGPQGTLYGSNAIGGTVRVITKKPTMDEFEFSMSTQINSQKRVPGNDTRIDAAVNFPINDTMAMRITGSTSDDNKATTNINTGAQGYDRDDMIRTQLLWQPKEHLSINLEYIKEKERDFGDADVDTSTGFYNGYNFTLSENVDAPFGYDVTDNSEFPDCPDPRAVCFNGGPITGVDPKYALYEAIDPDYEYELDLFAINLENDNFFDIGRLTYSASYRESTSEGKEDWSRRDGADIFKTWIISDSNKERTTHELRLQNMDSDDSSFDWTVGYFYDKRELGGGPNGNHQYHADDNKTLALATYLWGDYWGYLENEYESLDGQTSPLINTIADLSQFYWQNNGTNYQRITEISMEKEQALFGELSYTTDIEGVGELELTGGIRFYELEDHNRTTLIGIWAGSSPNREDSAGKESGNRVKLSASLRPSENMSLYAVYSEGYRPGGNNIPQLPPGCGDEPNSKLHKSRYESDELKNYEFGFKGLLLERTLSVAAAIYRIEWDGIQSPIRLECGFRFTSNAATAQSQGFEFESSYYITPDLKMTFNYGYTEAKMTADVPRLDIESGEEMAMVPKYNAYLALDQGFSLWDHQAFIRADISAYGRYNSDFIDKREVDEIPAYESVNLSGRFEINDRTQISLHINNLLDEEIITYKQKGKGGNQWLRYGNDRNVTLRLDYIF